MLNRVLDGIFLRCEAFLLMVWSFHLIRAPESEH